MGEGLLYDTGSETKYEEKIKQGCSTNISKTNDHLSPQTIEHKTTPRDMTLEILVWNKHKKVAVLSMFNRIPILSSW